MFKRNFFELLSLPRYLVISSYACIHTSVVQIYRLWCTQCEKSGNLLSHEKLFREMKMIHYYLTKMPISHNFWSRNSLSPKKFRQLFSNLFSKTVTFTEFLPKMRESEFPVISTLWCGNLRIFVSLPWNQKWKISQTWIAKSNS